MGHPGSLGRTENKQSGPFFVEKMARAETCGAFDARRFKEVLLQAADKLDQALDLVVSQFTFEFGHLVLALFGDFDQVGV
jgi:hypothetical protein